MCAKRLTLSPCQLDFAAKYTSRREEITSRPAGNAASRPQRDVEPAGGEAVKVGPLADDATITRLLRSNERWVSQTFASGVILIDTQSPPDRTRIMDAEERAFWHERGQLIDRVIEETRRTNPEHWAFEILQENVSY